MKEMKETFQRLDQIFPDMPPACDNAFMKTVCSVEERASPPPHRRLRLVAIVVVVLLALTCTAGATFYSEIVAWFEQQYGQSYGAWMEQGMIASPNVSVEENGAVFTINEILVRGRGLYVMGTIRAAEGFVLVDGYASARDAFGYNVHKGEKAPAGAPSIKEWAAQMDSSLRYVECTVTRIGVDGGTMLSPDEEMYITEIQRDGSIIFTLAIEDGQTVEPGTTYTLELCLQTCGARADGSIDEMRLTERSWLITIVPSQMK